VEETVVTYLKIMNFSGGAEKMLMKISCLRFDIQLGDSRIQSRIANHETQNSVFIFLQFFNSLFLCAASTAKRPNTDRA
jgi:hypothetical protein